MSQGVFEHFAGRHNRHGRSRSQGSIQNELLTDFWHDYLKKDSSSELDQEFLSFPSSALESYTYTPLTNGSGGTLPLSLRSNYMQSPRMRDQTKAEQQYYSAACLSREALNSRHLRLFFDNPKKRRSLSDISSFPFPSNKRTHRSSPQLQAIITTQHKTFDIWSANDYFCLLFGLAGSQLNKFKVFTIFPPYFAEELGAQFSSFPPAEPGIEERVIYCGDTFPVQTVDGLRLMAFWVKEKGDQLIWILEAVECTYHDFTVAEDGHVYSITSGKELDISLLSSRFPTSWSDRVFTTHHNKSESAFPSVIFPIGESTYRFNVFQHMAGLLFLNSRLIMFSLNEALMENLLGLDDLYGKHISVIMPEFEAVLSQLCQDGNTLLPGKVISEVHFRHAYNNAMHAGSSESMNPHVCHADGSLIEVNVNIVTLPFVSAGREDVIYGVWLRFTSEQLAYNELLPYRVLTTFAEDAIIEDAAENQQPASIPDEAEDWESPPTTISAYHTIKELGVGAYGRVRLASYKRKRDHEIIVKCIIKTRILLDAWMRDRQLGTVPMEISVLNFLIDRPHPNVVKMISYFEDDDNYYLVMEPHRNAIELFDYIEVREKIPEEECKAIFYQMVLAVAHLHSYNIIHRDIKDENIVIDDRGWAKLIDFGSSSVTWRGPFDTFRGTVGFAAPELLRGEKYLGKEQDIWALGVLLYTILYRENPYYNIEEILDAELRIPYIISEESADLIRKLLDRNVEARLTIEQTLQHKWFDNIRDLDEKLIPVPLTLT
ncbi:CAMK/CAMKL/PASK protein kinase Ppk6 [Schizosaccharomyces japonicus yFS275]|uniref:non-specific serine/threonine protein kinase n=1 Tax=Schizosaccharomyces japonicus (strain yFS275 / FY16936) TaxID=402676 RepID=B6JXR5_SCHJY|nr:CAMK/CAMKL/PASK protein kinase Ppk6 [Schizosaccharomyces japonicus yFS275]EEB06333.1 CAMK/CAMKL/PASK protein kinase Ppk6 [Schizosaccharomyces japonicus yFS275]